MKTSFLILTCGLCLTVSCRKEPAAGLAPLLDSNVLVRVQGTAINDTTFRQRLRERIGMNGATDPAATKQAVLEEMIRHEAVYAQARAAHFDQEPDVAASIKNLIVSRFMNQQLKTTERSITDADTLEYYNRHAAEFVTPAAVRGAIVLLRGSARMAPEKREELKRLATRMLQEARAADREADFVRLVQRHSEHQVTRYRGGDLGWLSRAECEARFGIDFSAALFALKEPNEFAPLLETPEGFYILKLTERKDAQPRPLAEVKELIRYQLQRQHQFQREEEYYVRMKQGLDVQINRPLLESISISAPEQNPPVLPAGTQRIVTR